MCGSWFNSMWGHHLGITMKARVTRATFIERAHNDYAIARFYGKGKVRAFFSAIWRTWYLRDEWVD